LRLEKFKSDINRNYVLNSSFLHQMKREINYELWKTDDDWFASWFNSHAYHLLYGNRDEDEAKDLINQLHIHLGNSGFKVLDAGCGAGRHVFAWAQLGYDVAGFDLSPQSIEMAQKRSNKLKLSTFFKVLDLRDLRNETAWHDQFDLVTNLFTSFGYFSDKQDHYKVVEGFSKALKPNGVLVLDYLNLQMTIDNLTPTESIAKGAYTFEINRRISGDFIQKSISFIESDGERHTHVEQVYAWSHKELSVLLGKVGLIVESIYGDYELGMHSSSSPRCILVARKMEV